MGNNIQNVDITIATVDQLNALVTVLGAIIDQIQAQKTIEQAKYTDGTDSFSQRIAGIQAQITKVQTQIATATPIQ